MSLGLRVTPSDHVINLETMPGTIQGMIAYSREYANGMRTELSRAIANLQEVVKDYKPDIDEIVNNVGPISRPSFPARPIFGPLNLDQEWPDSFIPDPALRDYGLLDFEFTAPIAPGEVDESFTWTPSQYTSQTWQVLFRRTYEALSSDEYGMTAAVRDALVAMEQETRRANQDKEFRALVSAAGATGWNIPSGQMAGMLSEFGAEILKRDQDALNGITAKMFDVSNDNRKFFITSGIEIEKLLRGSFEAIENRSLEAAKAAKEFVARFLEQNIKLYLGKWEAVKVRFEAMSKKIDAIAAYNKNQTEIFSSRANALESRVKAISEKNRALVEARRGEVDTYKAEVEAVAAEYEGLVKEITVNQRNLEINVNKALRIEELKLSAFTEKAKLGQTIALGVANIASQGVAAALGSINTTLGNSYTGHESRTESWNHGDQLSESHNYQYKGE